MLSNTAQRHRIIGIQPGGLRPPQIDEIAQLVEIVFLFLQKPQRLTLVGQGSGEIVDLGLAEMWIKILDAFVQCQAFPAEPASTHQQHRFMLGHRANGRVGEYGPAFAGRGRFDHDPLAEPVAVTRFVAQAVLSVLLCGLQDSFEKVIGFMDRLILAITHLILPGIIANQHPHARGVFGADAVTQLAIECALTNLETQVAEGIGVKAQGAQHQALGVGSD
ncbi:hypothetical protein D3C84_649560 [compost metagenome]